MTETQTIQQETNEEAIAAETPQESRETASETSAEQGQESPSLVPVTEAKKYRKRAQSAEQSLRDVEEQLNEKDKRVEELEQTITELERKQRIDALLIESEAIDLEAARLLTEVAVRQMDEPDVVSAVAELKRTRPFLFRAVYQSRANGSGAMSARTESNRRAVTDADQAAAEATETGQRNDLLRYLRLRRKRQNPDTSKRRNHSGTLRT